MPTITIGSPYFRAGHGYSKGFRPMNTSNPINNNNGTALNAGSVATTGPITNAPTSFLAITGNLVPGPRARSGTRAIISAGTFNNQVVGNYAVKGGSHMSTLAGVASTHLNTPTRLGKFNKSINSLLWRTSLNAATSWNLVSGQPSYPTTKTVFSHFGTDNAANPTSAIPGRLTYLITGMTPFNDYYNIVYLW